VPGTVRDAGVANFVQRGVWVMGRHITTRDVGFVGLEGARHAIVAGRAGRDERDGARESSQESYHRGAFTIPMDRREALAPNVVEGARRSNRRAGRLNEDGRRAG
jgi:hypothetical protein